MTHETADHLTGFALLAFSAALVLAVVAAILPDRWLLDRAVKVATFAVLAVGFLTFAGALLFERRPRT